MTPASELLQTLRERTAPIEEEILPGPVSENKIDLFFDVDVYNHCDEEVIMNPDTETVFGSIKPEIKKWLDDNITSWKFDEDLGEYGLFVFENEEDVTAFKLRWG